MQVKPTLAKMSSCWALLIVDQGHGHLGASSAHLAALWIMGLASALSRGDSALLPARTRFCPHAHLHALALMLCRRQGWGSFVWPFCFFLTPLLTKWFLHKCTAIYTIGVVTQGKNWGLCGIQLYPLHSRQLVLYNAAKHRTIQDSFASDILQVPTAVWFTSASTGTLIIIASYGNKLNGGLYTANIADWHEIKNSQWRQIKLVERGKVY